MAKTFIASKSWLHRLAESLAVIREAFTSVINALSLITNISMINKINFTEIIIRNICFIVGLYLVVFDQMEITTAKIIGFILLIFGFNTWMIREGNRKVKSNQKS